MYHNKKIIAVIPARGGSKGIPRKNIRILAGKPMIFYSIQASLESKYVDRTIVSTEDEEISEISKKHGAEIIERPQELATDDTPTIDVLNHAVDLLIKEEGYAADAIVLLQPTSPLREASDIDAAIEKFFKTGADLVVGVNEMRHHPYWSFKMENDRLLPMVNGGFKITKRQDLPKIYSVNGAIYVLSNDNLKKKDIFIGDMRAILMDEKKSIDIDTPLDFKIAELLIKERERNGKH